MEKEELEGEQNTENQQADEELENSEQTNTGEETNSEIESEEEFSVVIEGEEPEVDSEEEELKKAPQWVKDLRKKNRELEKQIKELSGKKGEDSESLELGPEPQLEDSDVDFDTAKYKSKLATWLKKKEEIERVANEKKSEAEKQQQTWNKKLESYNEGKVKLQVKDAKEVEETVKTLLSVPQQAIIIQGAENPALLVYAIGKNESTLKKLSAISDPVEFAFAVAKLETKLKTSTVKKPSTTPEKVVTGSGSKSATFDTKLEELRAEAEKTGDLSKLNAYKRSLRNK